MSGSNDSDRRITNMLNTFSHPAKLRDADHPIRTADMYIHLLRLSPCHPTSEPNARCNTSICEPNLSFKRTYMYEETKEKKQRNSSASAMTYSHGATWGRAASSTTTRSCSAKLPSFYAVEQ